MSRAASRWVPAVLGALVAPYWALATPATNSSTAKGPDTQPCESCHGARGEGIAAAHIPRLTGQSADYLKKQLDDYASGTRQSPVMSNFAKLLTDAQRTQWANRFAGMTAPYAPQSTPAPSVRQQLRGHQLAYQGDETLQVQACNSCHGPDGVGILHSAPYLAGQSSEYIATALAAFKTGTRKNDDGELMRSVAARLNEDDISAVSAYFSRAGAAHPQPASASQESP